MITKKRLKELREQGATIYRIKRNSFIIGVSEFVNIKEIKSSLVTPHKECISFYDEEQHSNSSCLYEELFETEEDAEEYLKYGNITREEKLELPLWSEVKEKEIIVDFYTKPSRYRLCCIGKRIGIIKFKDDIGAGTIFNKPLTRENYNEARDLYIKLFKGEKV